MRKAGWAIALVMIWTAAGLAIAVLERPLFEAMWIGVAFLYLFYALFGLCAAGGIAAFAILERNLVAGFVAVSFLIIGPILWFSEPALGAWGTVQIRNYRFQRDLPSYEKIVGHLDVAAPTDRVGEKDGVRYEVDLGPPVRVAFPQPGGLLDNWEGIIYDPTGEVEKAQGWTRIDGRQAFTAPDHVVRLFGGNIVSCVQIQGPYYRCWFT